MSYRDDKALFRMTLSCLPDPSPLLIHPLHDLVGHDERLRIAGFPGCIDPHNAAVDRRNADELLFCENHVAFAIKSRKYTPNITLFTVNIHIGRDKSNQSEGGQFRKRYKFLE